MGLDQNGAVTTVAEAYLSVLRDRGVRRLFVNAGTDFAPFVEGYARQKQSGLDFPELVVCAHENLAMSMAHGAYLGDGHVQAVMVHTSVGTANAVCGVFNASTDRIPILLAAGRSPLFEDSVLGSRDGTIHWAQEMYDQASMVREFVKWDYELRDGVQVAAVLDRAIDIAMTAPRGPVYLSLPREVLARAAGGAVPARGSATPTDAAPDPVAVERLADLLADARFPVFVTAASGIEPGTADLLGQLCGEYSVGVCEFRPRCYNVAPSHPLHIGYDPGATQDADVVCFLDMDVPWIPAAATPAAGATVVQCGPDPHFSRYPIRTHRSDLSVTASTANLLAALAAALPGRRGRIAAQRRVAIEKAAADSRSRIAERLAAASRADGPITKAFMNWALAQVLPQDASVVSEYWARPELLPLGGALSYFGTPPAGGLGWGLPAAMGLKLARPERTVISAVGDGAYMFANPAACHHAMAMHDIPVLTVICANRKWTAVQGSALGMYPEGHAAAARQLSPLAELGPPVAFEQYAAASGGYGKAVADRRDLVPALTRALHAVQSEHRQAVVNVSCQDLRLATAGPSPGRLRRQHRRLPAAGGRAHRHRGRRRLRPRGRRGPDRRAHTGASPRARQVQPASGEQVAGDHVGWPVHAKVDAAGADAGRGEHRRAGGWNPAHAQGPRGGADRERGERGVLGRQAEALGLDQPGILGRARPGDHLGHPPSCHRASCRDQARLAGAPPAVPAGRARSRDGEHRVGDRGLGQRADRVRYPGGRGAAACPHRLEGPPVGAG